MKTYRLYIAVIFLLFTFGSNAPSLCDVQTNGILVNTASLTNQDQNLIWVYATGQGTSKRDALDDAFRTAIERVVGIVVSAHTSIENGKLVEETIVSFSNGGIATYENVKKPSFNKQTGIWNVEIDAQVNIKLLFEQPGMSNMPEETKQSFAVIYARLSTREYRDKTAIQIINESMDVANYPLGIWSIQVSDGIIESGGQYEGDDIIIVPVEFKVDKRGWDIFSQNLKNALNYVCSDKDEKIQIGNKHILTREIFTRSLTQNKKSTTWGRVSLSSLKEIQDADPYLKNAIPPTSLGTEDVIVVIGNDTDYASFYAVAPEIFDAIWTRIHLIPVAKLLISNGKQLTDKKFQSLDYIHENLTVQPHTTYLLQRDARDLKRKNYAGKVPRTLYLAPYIACEVGCPTLNDQPRKNIKFLTPALTFDFEFAISRNELTEDVTVTTSIDTTDCLPEKSHR